MTNMLEAYYTMGEKIGKGAYGSVYYGTRNRDSVPVAIKVANVESKGPQDQNDIFHEVMVMSQVEHRYIVRFYDAFMQDNSIITCMEYVEGGNLADSICAAAEEKVYIPEEAIWEFAAQMCLGLKYLHDRRIVHRDLKPTNVMLDKEGNVKIADFGFGKLLGASEGFESIVGSPLYQAPELIAGKGGNEKVDVWAFGCILYELATLKPPFDAETKKELARNIFRASPTPLSSYYSRELNDFIFSTFVVDMEKRPSINTLLRFPKLRQVISDLDMLNPLDDEESCVWQEMTKELGDNKSTAAQLSWLVHEVAKLRVDMEAIEEAKKEKADAKPEEILGLSRRSSSKIRDLMREIEEERERLRAKETELAEREHKLEKRTLSGEGESDNDDEESTDIMSDEKTAPALPQSPVKKPHKKRETGAVPFEMDVHPSTEGAGKATICKEKGYVMIPCSHLKLSPTIPAGDSLKSVYAWHKKGKNTGDLPRDCFSVTPTWVNADSRVFTKPCKHITFLFRIKRDPASSSRPFYLKSAFATFVGGSISDKIVFRPEDTTPVPGVTLDDNAQWLYARYTNESEISQMRLEFESPSLLEEVVILYGNTIAKTFSEYAAAGDRASL